MLTCIATEVYSRAVDLRARADALKVTLRECPMVLSEKTAIKRQIASLEAERRSMLLIAYTDGLVA